MNFGEEVKAAIAVCRPDWEFEEDVALIGDWDSETDEIDNVRAKVEATGAKVVLSALELRAAEKALVEAAHEMSQYRRRRTV